MKYGKNNIMDNKKIIQEISRIQEVMYGSALLTEITNPVKMINVVEALLKFSDAKVAKQLKTRLNAYVKGLKATTPRGRVITDYRELKQIEQLKGVLKFLTGDTDIINSIMPAIKGRYKTEKLFQGDEGYELQKFVDNLSMNDDITKNLHPDFVSEFNKVMKEINNPAGIIKTFVTPITKLSWAELKNTLGIMSNKQYDEIRDKLIPHMGANFTRALMADAKRLIMSPLTALKWFGKGLIPKPGTSKLQMIGNVLKRLLIISGVVVFAEAIRQAFNSMDSLLNDGGSLWASLPPKVKEVFGIPQEEARAKAQEVLNELNNANPDEGKIKDILSLNGQGSKLIANQIAYEFDRITKGDLTLMQVLDENLTMHFDKIATAWQLTTGVPIPFTDETFTSSDIMKYLNSKDFPAANAPILNLDGKLEEIAKLGIAEVASYSTFRVQVPKPISNDTAAIFSNKGKYMTPDQLQYLTKVFDLNNLDGWGSTKKFIQALSQLNKDDFKNQESDDKFIAVDGNWENGVFNADNNDDVEGNEEIKQHNNEEDIRQSMKDLYKASQEMFNTRFFGFDIRQ